MLFVIFTNRILENLRTSY